MTRTGMSSCSSSRRLSPTSLFETSVDIRSQPERNRAAQRRRADQRARCVPQRRGAEPVQRRRGATTSSAACIRAWARRLTVKTGVEGVYQDNRSFSEQNFGGSFTFSNLGTYLAGQAVNYRVTRGDPLLEASQFEVSLFLQNDVKLTPRATLMAGVRYDAQSNLSARDNVAPAARIRLRRRPVVGHPGGRGAFPQSRSRCDVVETQRRLDGTRQFELIVDRASYPDPFQSGTIRNTLPSVQVLDPNLDVPSIGIVHASFERTFFRTLLFSASYEHNRDRRLRFRNLNAPLPGQTVRPGSGARQHPERRVLGPRGWQRVRLAIAIDSASSTSRRPTRVAKLGRRRARQRRRCPTNNYDLAADWGRIPTPVHQFNSQREHAAAAGDLPGGRRHRQQRPRLHHHDRQGRQQRYAGQRSAAGGRRFGERGPAFFTTDFNISKAFFLGAAPAGGGVSRTNVNVFVNMTNAFNRTNLGQPSGVMTSPNFGKSTSAENPREVEGGIRFQF